MAHFMFATDSRRQTGASGRLPDVSRIFLQSCGLARVLERHGSFYQEQVEFILPAGVQGHTHQTWAQGGTSGERDDDTYNARVAVKGVVDRSKNDAPIHALPASIVLDLWMIQRHFATLASWRENAPRL